MGNYVLDANVIIKLWNEREDKLDNILNENKIIILDEILKELAKKERVIFKDKLIMSERFMRLVEYETKLDKRALDNFIKNKGFYKVQKSFYYKGKKISKNDLCLIVALVENRSFSLITEDLNLIYVVKELLGEDKVLNIEDIIIENKV